MRDSFGLRWLATLGLTFIPATAMSSGPLHDRSAQLRYEVHQIGEQLVQLRSNNFGPHVGNLDVSRHNSVPQPTEITQFVYGQPLRGSTNILSSSANIFAGSGGTS